MYPSSGGCRCVGSAGCIVTRGVTKDGAVRGTDTELVGKGERERERKGRGSDAKSSR